MDPPKLLNLRGTLLKRESGRGNDDGNCEHPANIYCEKTEKSTHFVDNNVVYTQGLGRGTSDAFHKKKVLSSVLIKYPPGRGEGSKIQKTMWKSL